MRPLRFVRASAILKRSKSVSPARAFWRDTFLPHALAAHLPSTSALFQAASSAAASHARSHSTFKSVIAKRRRLITSGLTPGAATSTYEYAQSSFRTVSLSNHPSSRTPARASPPRVSRFRVTTRMRASIDPAVARTHSVHVDDIDDHQKLAVALIRLEVAQGDAADFNVTLRAERPSMCLAVSLDRPSRGRVVVASRGVARARRATRARDARVYLFSFERGAVRSRRTLNGIVTCSRVA